MYVKFVDEDARYFNITPNKEYKVLEKKKIDGEIYYTVINDLGKEELMIDRMCYDFSK